MFAKSIARIFGTNARTPIRNANRFRPQVEGLEAREVPAMTWTGGGIGTGWLQHA